MKLSMRWQLVAIICTVIIISFAALMAIVKYVLIEDYAERMRSNDVQLTYVIVRNIHQTLEKAFSIEHIIAGHPNVLSMPEPEQKAMLRRMRDEENSYELLALVNMDGMQLARTLGPNGDRSTRSWFLQFKETGKNAVSQPYYSSSTKHRIITLVQGIYEDGVPQGLVMGDINTTSLQDFIQNYNDNSECSVYLLDQNGITIACPKDLGEGIFNFNTMECTNLKRDAEGHVICDDHGSPLTETAPFSGPYDQIRVIKEALSGKVGSTTYKDDDGKRVLCVYRSISLPHMEGKWTLIFTRPYSSIQTAVDHLFHQAAMASILVALLASLGIIIFSKYITQPILEVIDMAKRVRAGDLSGTLPSRRQDEIGILIDTINHMIQGLRDTKQKQQEAEAKIRNMAYHDALTGLSNRTHFMAHARDILHKSIRRKRCGAILFVDVDKFKFVNDTYGHAVGDGLLIAFGKRLVEVAQRKEHVCRFGGDEFLLLLPDADLQSAAETAETIVQKMRNPFCIGDHEFSLSASVGLACYPKDATNIDELLQRADTALYASKRNGRNQYNIYQEGMQVEDETDE